MNVYDTRQEMIKDIVPKGTVGCELGVYAGEFAEYLHNTVKPSKMYLIDGWDLVKDTLFTADQDGNGSIIMSAVVLHNIVIDLFEKNPEVIIWKGWTHEKIIEIPDNTLDWIYIDADHSYEGCLRDLELSITKVKKDGLIMGHDYQINKKKCTKDWKFGVGKAVDQFLVNHPEYKLIATAMDGCVSFCLKII